MFKDYIQETPFTSEAANDYFNGRITGQAYAGDYSFLSTMRALLDRRIPGDAKINFVICNSFIRSNDMPPADAAKSSVEAALRRVFDKDKIHSETFYLHTFTAGHDLNEQNMKFVEDHFLEFMSGWKRLDNVTSLFSGSNFRVACFVNEEDKTTMVFASDFTIRKYHLLQCALLGMVPWYFTDPADVTEVEKKLIYSMLGDSEESCRQYMECIETIAGKYDFEAVRARNLLKGFESKYNEIERSKAEREVADCNRQIDNLNNQLRDILLRLHTAQAKMLGFDLMINGEQDGPTILEYFEKHKNLYLDNVSGTSLIFAAKGYLTYYDQDLYTKLMNSKRCYAYRYVSDELTYERVRKLMDAIFIDQEIRLRICAAYKIDISGAAYGLTDHTFAVGFKDYYQNPHIRHHGCLGDNRTAINAAIKDGNYLFAIEQCIASSINLFFGDPTVINEFFSELMNDKKGKYYELPDGRNVNIMEAVKWLEDRENSGEHEEEE